MIKKLNELVQWLGISYSKNANVLKQYFCSDMFHYWQFAGQVTLCLFEDYISVVRHHSWSHPANIRL